MRVIYVMADSMRRDHVSVYGTPPWGPIQTPSLEQFAASAAVFDNAYIGSFPTVPNRRDTLLGRGDKGLPFNRWRGLDPDEVTFPAMLRERGVPSMLITDTQNNVNAPQNLQRDYSAWALNRGQEADRCWLDDTSSAGSSATTTTTGIPTSTARPMARPICSTATTGDSSTKWVCWREWPTAMRANRYRAWAARSATTTTMV